MVAKPQAGAPTLADLEALPKGVKGEIIEGVLYTMTRPRGPHQAVGARMTARIGGPFDWDRNGIGGWWILPEPGIELPNTPEIAPDIAGWRKERLPELPVDSAIRGVPDWVCEILSPTTRRHNVLVKLPYYAKVGVKHHWVVDWEAQTLQVFRLEGDSYRLLITFGAETEARLEPFDAVPLDVSAWWL